VEVIITIILLLLLLLLYPLSGGGENYNTLTTFYLRVNESDGNNTFGTYFNLAFKLCFPVWCMVY